MGRLTRFTPRVVLFHHIIQVFHLPDDDVGPVLLVVALDGGFIGVTAVNRDRLRDPVAADRLGQKPESCCFILLLREQEVNGLAVVIDRPIQITPLALDPNIRFIHALRQLTQTGRLRRWNAASSCGLYLITHRLMVARSTWTPRSRNSSSTWRVLSGYATYQRTPVRMISCGKWAPLKFTATSFLPLSSRWMTKGDHTSNGLT